MDVPRSWWERALKTGYVDDTHVSILREFLAERPDSAQLGRLIDEKGRCP